MFIDYRQEQWPEQLGMTEFAYNNKVHSGTKVSLFEANNSQSLRIEFELRKKKGFERVKKFAKRMEEMQNEAKAILIKMQEKMRQYVDKKRREAVEYKVRDLVLLSTRELQ